ncbi:glycerophosphotransferase [Alteribacter lacisalsi]|uniref:Glycerophosphotransferase n=2 Tax=Alteribacter lacisalsi TaxID=2045244 RepID=A0A2W0H7Z9_9BACI|nr:glycerophosphotransferase [Alteribacter lacisalsi]
MISVFNRMPIKKNKVFFTSYYGSQYGCNPKYVTEHILKNYPAGTFDLVWAFNRPEEKGPKEVVRKVKVMSLRYFYELCTSKIVLTNFRTTDLFVKRKDQYYIQTWHSSLRLKQIEKDAEESLPEHYVEMAKKDSEKIDLLLSGCRYSTSIFDRSFWFEGFLFEHGTPRNDLLIKGDHKVKDRIYRNFHLPKDEKIILYAPTFRKDNRLDVYDVDYENVLERLKMRFGGEWTFLVKLHPHLSGKSDQLVYGERVKDATDFDDIQELLSVSDALITDYSSLMFDFAITGRPCFLYTPDLHDYVKNDRRFYFEINELPFIKTETAAQLVEAVEKFDYQDYERKVSAFHKEVGTFERGEASEKLTEHMQAVIENREVLPS